MVISNVHSHSKMDIYILLGQSNMAGRGKLADLPQWFPRNRGRLFAFNNTLNSWVQAAEPLQDPDDPVYAVKADRGGGIGPGLSFADAMAGFCFKDIGVILCARGGTAIAAWQRNTKPTSLYGALMSRVYIASNTGSIRGIIIYHGESDTKNSQMAFLWKEHFVDLVRCLRYDLGNESLPVVFAQLATVSDSRRARKEHGYAAWDLLKSIQAEIKECNVAMVQTDDLSLTDGLHLDTKSQIILGQRFAQKMLTLI